MKRWIWPVGIYTSAALVLTWPLVLHITEAIPLGSERSATVPLFNMWTLGWNVSRIQVGYQGYWDAPIFYPVQGAFAFSEPQPLTGLMAAPLWVVSPALAYNAILLLFLVLNGLAVNAFLRRRGFAFAPALAGGLLALSLPFLTQERGVLQLLPIFGIILALDGLWSMADSPTWRAGLRLGLGTAITFLVSEQFALFLGLLMLVAIPFLIPQFGQRHFWLNIGLAAAITTAIVLPVAIPQTDALKAMAFTRSTDTVARGSAQLTDYLRPSSATRQSQWFPLKLEGNHRLFPGAVLISMALVGTTIGLNQKRYRKWTIFLVLGAALAVLISLGHNLSLADWHPYGILRALVPGFSNLRSPFRIGYFVQIYLLLLATLLLQWLGKRQRLGIAWLLVGLVFLDVFPLPARLAPIPATIKSDEIIGPAIFLPFPDDRATSAYLNTTSWMVASLPQSIPLVNGYSGYFPSLQSQLKLLLAEFPTPGGLAALRALGVKTILIRQGWMNDAQESRLAESASAGEILEVANTEDFLVYRLAGTHLHPASAYDGDWALEIDLDDRLIEIRAFAAVPDKQMYVMAPQIAPLNWRVRLTGPDRETSSFDVSPANAVLLYHGSDRWLRVHVSLPPKAHGQYSVELINDTDDRVLVERVIDVPED